MFDDVATVDWAALTHAYGPADDVPGLLRDLAAGSRQALSELYGTIWHQGTVYEATAHAVPLLIRILDAPAAPAADVLGLLGSIAEGTSYMDVHRVYLPRSRRDTAEVRAQMELELGWVAAAGRAVADGLPAYLRLLATHADPEVRADAAHLIGVLGSEARRRAADDDEVLPAAAVVSLSADGAEGLRRAAAGEVLPAAAVVSLSADGAEGLRRAAAGEVLPAAAVVSLSADGAEGLRRAAAGDADEVVRAAAVLSLGAAGAPFAGSLDDPRPLPRLAAAVVIARGDAESVAARIERDAPECVRLIGRLPSSSGSALAWVLRAIEPHWPTQVRLVDAWLRHPDPAIREYAALAGAVPLCDWRPAAAALVPALVAAQQDPSEAVRLRALWHLTGAGRAAAGGADALWAAVEREFADRSPAPAPSDGGWGPVQPTLGAAALITLSRLRDPRADACLAQRLRERPVGLSGLVNAVEALGPWAAACRAVIVDAIEAAPAGPDRARLIRAAGRIGADPAALVPVLRRQVAEHPHSAGTLLGNLGPAAAAARPELAALRASDDPTRRRIAARALWRLDGDPADLVDLLRDRLDDDHALEFLAELGPAAAELADRLPPIGDGDGEWRAVHAAVAYWRLTADPGPVVPVLVRHIRPVPWGVLAVRTLAEIGPAATAAISPAATAAIGPAATAAIGPAATAAIGPAATAAIGPAATAAIELLRAHAEAPYRSYGGGFLYVEGDTVAQDEGWAAVCAHALAHIEGREAGDWPDVTLPQAIMYP
ncbi:hypothetical protein [Dactylosporangium sp. CA-139066]|uniref:hypothetical protein n=1 Tax=Dactylosporangium sp. CA-139066 TaxID=3239930 RepID=UPI003D90B565